MGVKARTLLMGLLLTFSAVGQMAALAPDEAIPMLPAGVAPPLAPPPPAEEAPAPDFFFLTQPLRDGELASHRAVSSWVFSTLVGSGLIDEWKQRIEAASEGLTKYVEPLENEIEDLRRQLVLALEEPIEPEVAEALKAEIQGLHAKCDERRENWRTEIWNPLREEFTARFREVLSGYQISRADDQILSQLLVNRLEMNGGTHFDAEITVGETLYKLRVLNAMEITVRSEARPATLAALIERSSAVRSFPSQIALAWKTAWREASPFLGALGEGEPPEYGRVTIRQSFKTTYYADPPPSEVELDVTNLFLLDEKQVLRVPGILAGQQETRTLVPADTEPVRLPENVVRVAPE